MQLSRMLAAAFILPVLVGCAGSVAVPPTTTAAPTATSSPSPTPSALPTVLPTPTPSLTPAASPVTRIEVTLRDSMAIQPPAMTVPVGIPVTFVVTNAGAIDHEFYLGDEHMQADHAIEMADMDGMMGHDEPNGIAVAPHQTKELTFTFEAPGEWIAGCHVSGHYEAGMSATITIVE